MKNKIIWTALSLGFLIFFSGCRQKDSFSISEIPHEELSKITGSMFRSRSQISLSVYNGTDWTISDVDVQVTNKKKGLTRRYRVFAEEPANREERKASFPLYLRPYSYSTYTINVDPDIFDSVEEKTDWSWDQITSARGCKE